MLSNPRILKSFLLTNILVVRRQITAQVVVNKWFVCGKWFIGYNFGLDDGAESKTGTHKELVAFKILKYKYCVNQSRDMPLDGLPHLTILRKIVNYCSIGDRFKKRNRAITFVLFISNISNTSRLQWLSMALQEKIMRKNIILMPKFSLWLLKTLILNLAYNRSKRRKLGMFILFQKCQLVYPNKVNSPPIRQFPPFSIFGHVTCHVAIFKRSGKRKPHYLLLGTNYFVLGLLARDIANRSFVHTFALGLKTRWVKHWLVEKPFQINFWLKC